MTRGLPERTTREAVPHRGDPHARQSRRRFSCCDPQIGFGRLTRNSTADRADARLCSPVPLARKLATNSPRQCPSWGVLGNARILDAARSDGAANLDRKLKRVHPSSTPECALRAVSVRACRNTVIGVGEPYRCIGDSLHCALNPPSDLGAGVQDMQSNPSEARSGDRLGSDPLQCSGQTSRIIGMLTTTTSSSSGSPIRQ